MNVSSTQGPGDGLTEALLGAPLQMADQAMKVTKVNMQMQLKAQEMAQTQEVVAMMTGVGGNLDITV
jgi:hypothetical protein